MVTLKNQVALVTGASSGIGKAIALGLAAQGAVLGLVGRKLETLEAVAESAREAASHVRCYRADLTSDEDIQNLAACLRQDFDCVDLLIHSAGIIAIGRLESALAKVLEDAADVRSVAHNPHLVRSVAHNPQSKGAEAAEPEQVSWQGTISVTGGESRD